VVKVAVLASLVLIVALLVQALLQLESRELAVLGILVLLLFGRMFARAVRWLGTRFLPAKKR
jgi:hypothetical protein